MRGLGYKCREVKLTASHLGLPQRRTRHFSVGLRSSEIPDLTFQRIQEGTVEQAISDLLDEKQTDLFTTPSKHQPQNVERIAWLFGDGWTEEEKQSAFNLAPPGEDPFAHELINHRRPLKHQKGHSYPAVYGRMWWDQASPTITTGFGSTGQGRFVHPLRRRTLTPHEAARIQTFPDWFDFSDVTKRTRLHDMIGNAVPPLMGAEILERLLTEAF